MPPPLQITTAQARRLIGCFILLSFVVDRSLHFPRISYAPWNQFAGGLAVALGLFLMLLSVSYFVRARGTPLFIVINVWELEKVEEPELMKRLGKDYAEYRARVPMFFPCCRKKTY